MQHANTGLDLADILMSEPEEAMCRKYVVEFTESGASEIDIAQWAQSRFGGNQRRADIIASFVWQGVQFRRKYLI